VRGQALSAADHARAQTDKRQHLRRKVLIPARMKHGVGWSDVCIRDISSKGMLVQAGSPPGRGAYVEIRRGAHIIVAKVAWSQERQFGLTTQDLLPIDAIIQNPQGGSFGRSAGAGPAVQVERRASARTTAQSHALSRHTSSLMQYGFMLVLALAGAVAVMGFLRDAFTQSLGAVESALDAPLSQSPSGVR
jgi:hypothetical protein